MIVTGFLVACSLFGAVLGHGRLIDPAARNAMWRFGFPNPSNYNDNELNCGGYAVQWTRNKGKCGVCGDPYHFENQPHVEPGKFANGVIAKTYKEGDVIEIAVDLTSNHMGWFEFRIGAKGSGPIQQKDLTHLLSILDSKHPTRFLIPRGTANQVFNIKARLPRGLVCEQCVMQWKYNTGNSWGCDKRPRKCGVGYGPQENFVNCADIKIIPSDGRPLPNTPRPRPQTQEPVPETQPPRPQTQPPRPQTQPPTKRPIPPKPTSGGGNGGKCFAIGQWKGNANMDVWCQSNCALYCPQTHCKCT